MSTSSAKNLLARVELVFPRYNLRANPPAHQKLLSTVHDIIKTTGGEDIKHFEFQDGRIPKIVYTFKVASAIELRSIRTAIFENARIDYEDPNTIRKTHIQDWNPAERNKRIEIS